MLPHLIDLIVLITKRDSAKGKLSFFIFQKVTQTDRQVFCAETNYVKEVIITIENLAEKCPKTKQSLLLNIMKKFSLVIWCHRVKAFLYDEWHSLWKLFSHS